MSDDVLDGTASIAFDQAENRMHAQKAVLLTFSPSGGSADAHAPGSTCGIDAAWMAACRSDRHAASGVKSLARCSSRR